MIRIIHGEIWSNNTLELDKIICEFQSCVRYCYNRFFKEPKLRFNEVRKLAKVKYPKLNTRQISDAVVQGQALKTRYKNKKIIFGGRKAWEDYKLGNITKEQWLFFRDKQIYLRGDKTQKGNLNARIAGDTLRFNIGKRKWEEYKLFFPKKYQSSLQELLVSRRAYNVRLIRKDAHCFRIVVDYQVESPSTNIDFKNGVIGIDTNPDRIAIANVNKDGNLIETKSLLKNRILCGSRQKRDYDLGCLVKQIINYAIEKNKGLVFEDLKFRRNFKPYERKWNRKKSNFVWKRFINLLEYKCIENGIEYKKVNPAYTSVIGKYKYRWMYKINIHESAAYVIGRRGLGYNEKLSFYKLSHKQVKEAVLGTLAEKYRNKRVHSWVLWKVLNDNIEAILTGLRVRLADLKEFAGNIRNKSENLLGKIFQQELLTGSENCTIERSSI